MYLFSWVRSHYELNSPHRLDTDTTLDSLLFIHAHTTQILRYNMAKSFFLNYANQAQYMVHNSKTLHSGLAFKYACPNCLSAIKSPFAFHQILHNILTLSSFMEDEPKNFVLKPY